MKKINKHSSEVLIDIVKNKELKNKDLTFHQLLQLLGKRTFGIALLFFALPSILPLAIIPGISFIFSLPIMIFSLQMILGRNTLWLPKIMADYTIEYEKLIKIICVSIPYLIKIERFLKPRLLIMTSRIMESINGIVIFCLALLLILPIPFSNFIFGILIVIFSLGLIEKDGIFILTGYFGTICYITFVYTFILSAIKIIF